MKKIYHFVGNNIVLSFVIFIIVVMAVGMIIGINDAGSIGKYFSGYLKNS
jgi:hypothetical protein